MALAAGVACGAIATGRPAVAQAAAPADTAAVAAEPAGVRTIYLVRHGVYDETDPRDPEVGKALVPKGEEQARLVGARLAHLPVTVDALYASPMTRARQTAEIIGQALGGRRPELAADLKECTPPTERQDVMARQRPGEPDSCRDALERVWARFFRPSPTRDSTEVIVCHGNVIRYLVSRAVGLDLGRWLNMTIANCSLSVIEVGSRGRTRLVSYDDVGHLPNELVLYPSARWDPGPTPRAK